MMITFQIWLLGILPKGAEIGKGSSWLLGNGVFVLLQGEFVYA